MLSSAPNTVPSFGPPRSASRAAACANCGTPYIPSWSVRASTSSPSRAASATSSPGVAAPSRKLNEEWQCSSAHGTVPAGRGAGRLVAAGGRSAAGGPVPQDIRRCSSRQETGGLSQPT